MTTLHHLSRASQLLEELAINYADARNAGEVFGLSKSDLEAIELLRRATNNLRLRIMNSVSVIQSKQEAFEFEVLGI